MSAQNLEILEENTQENKSPSNSSKNTSNHKSETKQIITPRARRLAKELGIEDFSGISGSGPSGRVTEDDVREFQFFCSKRISNISSSC